MILSILTIGPNKMNRNRVGTGTSVIFPKAAAWFSRINADKVFSRKSTSPTKILDVSAPGGIFLIKWVLPWNYERFQLVKQVCHNMKQVRHNMKIHKSTTYTSPPSSIKVRNEGSCICAPPCSFMACTGTTSHLWQNSHNSPLFFIWHSRYIMSILFMKLR